MKILLWSALVIWTSNGQFLSKFSKKEIFFVNLEEGFFGCQVNETTEVLQIFKVEKLCDGKSDCYLGSDENQKELKCSSKYTFPLSRCDTCLSFFVSIRFHALANLFLLLLSK